VSETIVLSSPASSTATAANAAAGAGAGAGAGATATATATATAVGHEAQEREMRQVSLQRGRGSGRGRGRQGQVVWNGLHAGTHSSTTATTALFHAHTRCTHPPSVFCPAAFFFYRARFYPGHIHYSMY
jgi:hypothetical protein